MYIEFRDYKLYYLISGLTFKPSFRSNICIRLCKLEAMKRVFLFNIWSNTYPIDQIGISLNFNKLEKKCKEQIHKKFSEVLINGRIPKNSKAHYYLNKLIYKKMIILS